MAAAYPDFSGVWLLDLAKSDPIEPFLVLMDVPWAIRKVMARSTPTWTITQSANNFHLKIEGIQTKEEEWPIDGEWHDHNHDRAGPAKQKAEFVGDSVVITLKTNDNKMETVSTYSIEDGHLVMALNLTKRNNDGASQHTMRRVFKRT
eukprot:TRINITY_DN625_c0_g1_i1.p1 TRINITY_DN625_c0_g1~~TRINITY_DN625_c0_g1_i1.p1  ORF type:complete len:148 (+),score=55.75 TRINITY_DN625_c0_g1_i1:76-519(+)